MKKLFVITILLALLLATFCSCLDTNETQDQGHDSATPQNATTAAENGDAQTQKPQTAAPDNSSKSNLGDYNIVIESCRLAVDYEGAPIVFVKYQFTNNDSDAVSFMLAVSDKVYQEGIGLNTCYFVDDSANYSSDNQSKEIKQGASISVEVAYKLNDTTTDIEVEVSKLISFNDKKITKTFSIG